jgi:hypothetical protein
VEGFQPPQIRLDRSRMSTSSNISLSTYANCSVQKLEGFIKLRAGDTDCRETWSGYVCSNTVLTLSDSVYYDATSSEFAKALKNLLGIYDVQVGITDLRRSRSSLVLEGRLFTITFLVAYHLKNVSSTDTLSFAELSVNIPQLVPVVESLSPAGHSLVPLYKTECKHTIIPP